MRETNKHNLWTSKDDAYLQEHHGKLTYNMMAEDLGRTRKAVESRIKVLRAQGRMSPERISTGPKLGTIHVRASDAADVEAIRTEAAAYLAFLVKERRFSAERALLVARKLKAHLAMPHEYVHPRLNKPIIEWVQELAA